MKPTPTQIIVPSALRERFDADWRKCRVLYFCAPCGVGKTSTAHELLNGHCVRTYSALQPDFLPDVLDPDCDTVVFDDFQAICTTEEQQALCRLMNENPNKHFLLLSRCTLPGWLMPYQFTGLLSVLDGQLMRFDFAAIQMLFAASHLSASDEDLRCILSDTSGYPLLTVIVCRRMTSGKPYTQKLLDESRLELFFYLEEMVYRRFSPRMRFLLVALAPFDTFDSELAKLVSGDSHVNDILSQILHETRMMQDIGLNQYRFWPIFQCFLLWEMAQSCTVDQQNDIYRRAGLYYELRDDYAHAMDCYLKSGDHSKMSELLTKNAEQHHGMAYYYEMEPYYKTLSREEILCSPVLMCGMSLLSAITMDFEASESWYSELQNYAARLHKNDADYKMVQSKLLYLDIALPQRGSMGVTELINTAFRAMTTKKMTFPEFSVTSTLPSVMNGGKDFCNWSKTDSLLYTTMKHPLEAVLGRNGFGLADCSICESRFEKGEDISTRLLALVSRIGEIQRKGTPDIAFAVMGLLTRTQVRRGNAAMALETIETVRAEYIHAGQTRFLPNMDAMRCRIWLRLGQKADYDRWLREDAPPGLPNIRPLWRYQYITKAMVQLADGSPDGALLSTMPLLPYCETCGRVMDCLYLRVLMAIAHFRQQDTAWAEELHAALDTAHEYGFITPVAQFGAAVLPLLNACTWDKDPAYFERLLAAVREQTVNYPDFLRPSAEHVDPLTPAELQVLKLLCAHRSNQEIADILGTKLPTVKTQVSSIFQKLGIQRRSEAKDAAIRMNLF